MMNTPMGNPNRRGVLLPGLWAARVSAALSQRDLATMIDASQTTICKLEGKQRGAYPKTVKRLCQALGVAPSDLICMNVNDDDRRERQ
jgi:DNA-binding Xre family transcriptional regulator